MKGLLNRLAPYVLVAPAILVVGFGCLYPTLLAGRLGFFDWALGVPWSEAVWVGLDNFRAALVDPAFRDSFAVSILFAVVVVVIEMVLGTALALLLERPIRGVSVFRTLFITPMMIAPIVVGLIWRYLFDTQFGPANYALSLLGIPAQTWLADPWLAFGAIVVSDVWQWTPFVIIMVLAGLQNVDQSALEAARVDGATPWQVVRRVKLPMLAPVLVVTALMRVTDAFRVLEVIYALTFGGPGNSTEVLPLLISIVCLGPILVMVQTSFKVQTDIFSTAPVWLFAPTLANYKGVLIEDNFGRYLVNSIIVGTASTIVTLTLGSMAAYAIVRYRFIGRGVVSWTTLLLRSVPLAVLAVPVYTVWGDAGLLNSLTGLVSLYTAVNLPFTIWILYGFLAQIPYELEEAALVDGCSPYRIFFVIVLPLIRPGLAAAAIFTFRIAWNEFILALVLTNRATRTLPVAASLYITDVGVQWGKLMALGVLIALPPLVVTLIAARQIIAGLTAGAVKG